ncbi:MAG: VCBS repeat-containing protein, partial [Acidobacteria bacterium]|nr:VCBS repeat-containing protein [Acidobacteriota bacterium]
MPSAMPVAVADVDLDGRPDVLMGTATGIVLLPGNDSVVLGPGRQILPGHAVFNLAVDDFDRDGIPDIAAYCPLGPAVLILKGLGNGEFQEAGSIAISYYESRGLVSTDLNQDGIADLAAAQSNSVAVFQGNGDGTFRPAAEVPAKKRTWAVASGDFNGDGSADLAIVSGQTLAIARGSGGGNFQDPVEVPLADCGPSEIALSDLNRDGKTDIAAACGAGFASMLGNGDGTFRMGEIKRYSDQPLSIATGDINADGIPDAIVGNYYNGRISVFRGQGDGSFAELDPVPALGDVYGVAVADLNGDGKADIAASSYSSSSGLVAFGRGDGQFEAPAIFGASYALSGSFLRSADFDSDGQMDLAALIPLRKSAVFLRQGLSTMGSAGLSGYPMDAQAGDFNGDGQADLVAVSLDSAGLRSGNDARAAILFLPGRENGGFGAGVEVASMAYQAGGAAAPP